MSANLIYAACFVSAALSIHSRPIPEGLPWWARQLASFIQLAITLGALYFVRRWWRAA